MGNLLGRPGALVAMLCFVDGLLYGRKETALQRREKPNLD